MSIDNGTSHLCFPLRGEIPSTELLILRDVDVVGIGSLRRHQIEELQKSRNFILETHEEIIPADVHAIYQVELLQTLQWLRPVKVEAERKIDFFAEQRALFSRLFPKTEKSLSFTMAKVRDLYIEGMQWSSWLLQDHWRYFPGFLRQKFPLNTSLLELAHWEWVQAWIEIQPFGDSSSESGIVAMNPSLQIVSLVQGNSDLDREMGMYAFVYNHQAARVVEKSLDVFEAKILDLLHEDRKYTVDQLVSMAVLGEEMEAKLAPVEWEKKIWSLQKDGIISLRSPIKGTGF